MALAGDTGDGTCSGDDEAWQCNHLEAREMEMWRGMALDLGRPVQRKVEAGGSLDVGARALVGAEDLMRPWRFQREALGAL